LFIEEGQLCALRISWTYDAFTTLFTLDVLDLNKDGDGSLDDNDRTAIFAGETDWPPEYTGDIYLELAGQHRAFPWPENAMALMEEVVADFRTSFKVYCLMKEMVQNDAKKKQSVPVQSGG